MAQELPPELLNAVMQAESRGQRFDEKGRLLTSKKGAKGEMQVMDKTNLAPGFGVTPARNKSPDERARVGRDYLAAMVNRYPDRDTALMAYNWGPGNVDKWLKAGAPEDKVPEETRNYVAKIDQSLMKDVRPVQAKAAPAPAPEVAMEEMPDAATFQINKAVNAGISAQAPAATPAQTVASRTAAYGPSYQAALAVSMLGDEDEKEDKDPQEPTEAEKFLAAPTAASSLAKMDLSYSSPFAAIEPEPVAPIKMAAGGVPFSPTAMYRPSQKAEVEDIRSDWEKYTAEAEKFNAAAQDYQTKQYDPYIANLDAYNKQLEAWNAGPRETDFTVAAPTAPGEFAQATPVAPVRDQAYATAVQERAQRDVANRQRALDVASNPAAYNLSMPAFFADGGQVEPVVEEPGLTDVTQYATDVSARMFPDQMGQDDQRDAARHMLAAATVARKYGPKAAEMLGKAHEYTSNPRTFFSSVGIGEPREDLPYDLHNNRVGVELAARSKSQADLEKLVQEMASQSSYKQTPGKPWTMSPEEIKARNEAAIQRQNMPRPEYRADGSPPEGERSLTSEEIAAASQPATMNPNIQRQGAAARQLASMRDVNTLPDPKTYAAVSGLLGTAPDEQGFSVMHPQAAGIKSAGEAGFYAGSALGVAPMAAALRGPATALAKSEQAKMALEKMFPAAQPMYAVRPKGGAFMPEGQSTLDDFLKKYQQEIEGSPSFRDPEKQAAISDLLGKKARKYYASQFGTAEDPIRKMVTEGKVQLYGGTEEQFPGYLLRAARAGDDPMASRHLEKAYDSRTRMSGMMPSAAPSDYARTAAATAAEREKMMLQGLPESFQNPDVVSFSPSDLQKSYQSPARQKLGQQLEVGMEPEVVRRAGQLNEPVYDLESAYGPTLTFLEPRNLVEGLANVPTNKLKNMSFPDAVAEASGVMKLGKDFDFAVEAMREGRSYPKEMLSLGTKDLLTVPSGKWVQLVDPKATAVEGALMKHSVAGYYRPGESYGQGGRKAFEEGSAQVFSLRGQNNLPQVTIEGKRVLNPDTNAYETSITQVKGPYNSFPEKQKEQLFQFIDSRPDIKTLPRESYSKTASGQDLDSRISVDWEKEFADWKLRQ